MGPPKKSSSVSLSSPPTSSSSPPTNTTNTNTNTNKHHRILLLALACLGSGICSGFALFHVTYAYAYHERLQSADLHHQATQKELQNDILTCQTSFQHCQSSLESTKQTASSDSQQSSQQTLILSNAHSTLVVQHEHLLQQHATNLQKLNDAHATTTRLEALFQQRNEKVEAVMEQVQTCTSQHESAQAVWMQKTQNTQAQLEMAQSMLHEKMTKLSSSSSSSSSSSNNKASTRDCPVQLLDLQLALRRRYTARLLETYGSNNNNNNNKPSYLVEFTLQVPDALWTFPTGQIVQNHKHAKEEMIMHNTTIVVQLDQVQAYPVTTWTFLQLVKKGLYTGTRLVVPPTSSTSSTSTSTGSQNRNDNDDSSAFFVLGGNAQYTAHKRIQANLTRRLAEYTGHGNEPFLWQESAALVVTNAAAAATAAAAAANDNDATASSSSSSSSSSLLLPLPPPCDALGGFGFATRQAEFVILTSPRAAAQVAQYYNNNNNNNAQQQQQAQQSIQYPHYLTCPGRVVHGLNIVQQIIHATISLQQHSQQQQSQQDQDQEDQQNELPAATITSARIVSHKFEHQQQQQQQQQQQDLHSEF